MTSSFAYAVPAPREEARLGWSLPAWLRTSAGTEFGWNSAASAAVVVVDGQVRTTASLGRGFFQAWDRAYRLSLGDEVIGGRAWGGQIREASVDVGGEFFDLLDPAVLEVPRRPTYFPDRLRRPFSFAPGRDLLVALFYVMAFLPVAILLAVCMERRAGAAAWITTAALAAVVVEQGKVFVSGRHPSAIDIASYLVGAVLGGLLWRRRLRVPAAGLGQSA